jgi:hypothetical protein
MNAFFPIAAKRALIDFIASRPLKAALFTQKAKLSDATETYSIQGELSGPGYDAGGLPLVVSSKGVDAGNVAFLGFSNPTWSNASFTGARYLEIYDSETLTTYGVIDFGAEKSGQGADFTYKFPQKGGVIRI